MNGYLLDNNTVSEWFCQHNNVVAHVLALPADAPLGVSVVTIGEITCGHHRNPSTDPARRAEFEAWIRKTFPTPLEVSVHAARIYGELKAELFKNHQPQTKTRFVAECYDSVNCSKLGIDENDLWLAAQAIESNLVLVSNDKMNAIKTAAGSQLKWEDWRLPI